MLPMKPFTIFDASITLSLSDVSDADHYFPSLLKPQKTRIIEPCHLSVYSGTPELRQRQARLHEFDDAAKPAGEPGGFAPRHFLGLMG
jgi:hypothetical protein